MSTSKQEHLSALLDDEAGAFEQRRLLDELCQDEVLAQSLGRYALIGEMMRSRTPPTLAKRDFLAGLQERLAEEPTYSETVLELATPTSAVPSPSLSKPTVARPVDAPVWLRYGMAASLALAAVLGGLLMTQAPQQTEPSQLATQSVAVPAAPIQVATQLTADPLPVYNMGRLDPQTRDVLKQYVAQHVKYASTTALVPSVRAVSYSNDY